MSRDGAGVRFKVRHATAMAIVCAALWAPVGAATADTVDARASILGGNQVNLPISIPINICGIAIGILGDAFANCEGSASVAGVASAQVSW